MRAFFLTLLFILIFCAAHAHAANATQPKPLPPVTFQDGVVFEPMQFAAIAGYAHADQNDIHTGCSEDDPGYGKRRRTSNAGQLTLRAGLFKNFEAMLTATVWYKKLERRNAKGVTDIDDVKGLGDLMVMGRYQLLSQKKGDPLSLAMGLGLEIPTGDCDNRNTFGPQPYMGPFLQLGTGSWNPKATVSATRVFGRSRIDGQLMYTINTEGEHDLEKGDLFQYNLGYGYALTPYITAGLALNGLHQEKNTQQLSPGVTGRDVNSGSTRVFLAPEISYRIPQLNTTLGVAVPVSVYTDMEGSQPAEDFRIVAKLSVKF